MAFDQTTRNRLQQFVTDARTLLVTEFTRQLQNDYGMDPDTGTVSPLDDLTHLNDTQSQTARLLRDTKNHYQAASPSQEAKQILDRIVREQAFTVLNRLCALRMAETRGILVESIGKAHNSEGFQLYKHVAGISLGEIGDAYQTYLFSLFDEFAYDLAVLFDRYSSMGRLFPRESVLLNLLDKINAVDLEQLWAEDETIGWIYQYFNSVEERRQMRSESQAPRNSRELAVRNQFFTPRYVVEFLTDNTLGRIWYEMTNGSTRLTEQCRYLVRRPNEVFLKKGETAPESQEFDEDLSQEELLNQTVYIEHRSIKDPREILMLDPACGSMHFGLYAFDLFEIIYQEAWDIQSAGLWQGKADKDLGLLTGLYPTKEDLLRDIPRLIIENNIHGVDIDPRAVQIAGLSLWLRAQRSWKEQGVNPQERSRIVKSNIVCAEPMPGDKDLLKSFSSSLKPTVLGQLLEIIFEKMELAGEAGSLLKIEAEIETALEAAREAFNKELLIRNTETGHLPGMEPKVKQYSLFDFADLPSKTQFWDTAEEKILTALYNYAEHAEESDGGRRRLFAQDAARGFAFIDICWKRYDVVLMNPPFGNPPSIRTRTISLPAGSCSNLYAAFVIDGIRRLSNEGLIGAITDRTFILLSSYEPYRKILTEQSLIGLADFDWGVLDSAQVATCAYIVKKMVYKRNHIAPWFVDCRNYRNKSNCLTNRINDIERISFIPISIFTAIPTRPISHWAPKAIRNAYSKHSALEPFWGIVRKGLSPGDSPRFVKLWWEVPSYNRGIDKKWSPYANGGSFSPFYRVTKEVVEWDDYGRTIKSYRFPDGRPRFVIRSENLYSSEGLTYGKRGEALNVQILPAGQTFSNEGYYIGLGEVNKHWAMLGYLNSAPARYLINMVCGLHKEVGALKTMPVPDSLFENKNIIDNIKTAYNSSRLLNVEETNKNFFINSLNQFKQLGKYISNSIKIFNHSEADLSQAENEINKQVAKSLGLDESDLDFLINEINSISPTLPFEGSNNKDQITQQLISIVWGICFGRWDVRYATGEKEVPELPDPFDPLPVCPPGMLQNKSGLPAEPEDIPDDYPIQITWPGIIVDDEGCSEDILTRVREVLEVIWKENAGEVEQEACGILGVNSLRDYFSKPGKFFADHLKRYSKSRRQAPIYWPLSTPSGSYTLWVYYHRLTDQILYTCIMDFVEPKLKQVSGDAGDLRRKTGRTREEEKSLEKLIDLEHELTDFRDELLRVAQFWKPNLNDGVQITAAPLWKLFQLRKWQNKLKQTWEKLEKGEYDWSHLAYAVWPDRVIRASHKDRSYAIAHDLEDDLWEEVENGTDRQGNPKTKWVPKKLTKDKLDQIIQEKISGM